jgi:hypothetical protein
MHQKGAAMTTMMACLADELADTRAEIARLRRREADLRAALIAAPADQRSGRWNAAEVALRKRLVFNVYLLPPEIRQDPRYWEDRATHVVTVKPVQQQLKPRPGWPIRRDTAQSPGAALH